MMILIRRVLLVIGSLVAVVGFVWIGQGLGYFRYPERSAMIDQTSWAWRGLGLAVAGFAIVIVSRRIRRGTPHKI
jgi:hypothetical protein